MKKEKKNSNLSAFIGLSTMAMTALKGGAKKPTTGISLNDFNFLGHRKKFKTL